MKLYCPKLAGIAAAALLMVSLSFAQSEQHEKPIHHKAPKAQRHPAPKATAHKAPKVTKHKTQPAGHRARAKTKKRPRGQAAIDSARASQIRQALVREHYLKSTPSGTWDSETQEAMRRYQADHGWQNKTVPDSRALISLGLGPDHEHLLNPETAMTTQPQLPRGSSSATKSSAALVSSASPSPAPAATGSGSPTSSQSNSTSDSASDLAGSH